jgi:peptidoglycan/xylan/chitin deacetylase (PgdA/CDA1 family)
MAVIFSFAVNIARSCVDFVSVLIHPASKFFAGKRVRILCYHRVYDVPVKDPLMNYLSVPRETFRRQMSFLASNGYNVLTLEHLPEQLKKRELKRAVVITFDDGYRDNYLNALPVLKQNNLKANIFISTDYISGDGFFPWLKITDEMKPYALKSEEWLPLTRDQILEMGHDFVIGSHAQSHNELNNMAPEKVRTELTGSRDKLEKLLGRPVNIFCYPFGEPGKKVREAVGMAGYKICVTSQWGGNNAKSDLLRLKRITIEGTDSLGRFIRKVEGAYDWWFGGILPVLMAVQRLACRSGRER